MTARILVVDDVPANVKLLEARLSAEYFDVITASNGIEALALCEKSACDIVLLDVMMPGMDGFEVCRRIKANRATHHIPVVMVTALDHPSDRVRGLQAGAGLRGEHFARQPPGPTFCSVACPPPPPSPPRAPPWPPVRCAGKPPSDRSSWWNRIRSCVAPAAGCS